MNRRIRFDLAVWQEDIRKIGVALTIAGLVGTIIEHVPGLAALGVIAGGLALMVGGALKGGE